jgi:hypothetical protein
MKTITLVIPDDFTPEQEEFIRQSAMNQIEAELRKVLAPPPEQVSQVENQIQAVKEAMKVAKVVDTSTVELAIEEAVKDVPNSLPN